MSEYFTWWRHQTETFTALLAICAGNSPVPVNSTHKGQWCGALMFPLICAWINAWVNNPEAGDLRRNGAHYDVSVMINSLYKVTSTAFYGGATVDQSIKYTLIISIWILNRDFNGTHNHIRYHKDFEKKCEQYISALAKFDEYYM